MIKRTQQANCHHEMSNLYRWEILTSYHFLVDNTQRYVRFVRSGCFACISLHYIAGDQLLYVCNAECYWNFQAVNIYL